MAKINADVRCDTCDHWLRNRGDHPYHSQRDDVGDCRRWPPQFVPDSGAVRWPVVFAHHYCGEW